MPLKLSQLRTFVAVAEAGELRDAAGRLGRTPSAVSMALKQLEGELGKPLFEGDRKSRLTPLGRYVLVESRREMDHFDRTTRAVLAYARNEIGHLDVACVPSIATRVLPDVLSQFLEQWPGVTVDVRDMDSDSVCTAVDRGTVAVGIGTVTERHQDLESSRLLEDELGIVCGAAHGLTRLQRPLTWADLRVDRFIANGICELIQADDFAPILATAPLMVRNTTSILALVRSGAGVTILPRLAVPEQAEGVSFLRLGGTPLLREISIIRQRGVSQSPVTDAFVERLQRLPVASLHRSTVGSGLLYC